MSTSLPFIRLVPRVTVGVPVYNGARYLAAAVADLGLIARRHGLATLGFLLDMAQMEAEDIVRRRAAHERF